MPPKRAALEIIRELRRRTEKARLDSLYPDEGGLRRELYVKHVKMFEAGRTHDVRVAMGGNRVGKSLGIGAYETALHLTGLYPPWWKGRRYEKKILVWAAGTKAVKVRDNNQQMLLGDLDQSGGFTHAAGGLIPSAKIQRLTRRSGVTDAIDQAIIKHKNGWENKVTFKSYEEQRKSFEAEAVDFIWLDEECEKVIFDECKMRIMTTRGAILLTFTPLEGMTETVMSLLEEVNFI